VLVGLRWSLGGPPDRSQVARNVQIAMDFAAGEARREVSKAEDAR